LKISIIYSASEVPACAITITFCPGPANGERLGARDPGSRRRRRKTLRQQSGKLAGRRLVDTVQAFDRRQTRQLAQLLCRQEEPAVATLVEAIERPPSGQTSSFVAVASNGREGASSCCTAATRPSTGCGWVTSTFLDGAPLFDEVPKA
jgi:hypothetical protein